MSTKEQTYTITIEAIQGDSMESLAEKVKEAVSEGWEVRKVVAVVMKNEPTTSND